MEDIKSAAEKFLAYRAKIARKERVHAAGKTCTCCGIWKPIRAYHVNIGLMDGRSASCGACINKRAADKRHQDPAAYNRRQREMAHARELERYRNAILNGTLEPEGVA